MYFKSYFSTFVGVVKHMKTTMKTHIVLKNAINQKKKNPKNIKNDEKGKRLW